MIMTYVRLGELCLSYMLSATVHLCVSYDGIYALVLFFVRLWRARYPMFSATGVRIGGRPRAVSCVRGRWSGDGRARKL